MKNYVPVTLDQYVNESNSITLKRGYRGKNPVVVGANAPIRNQVLAYVNESKRVSSADLKRFVAGLNETNANPNAAATMWLRRNGKFFVTESKNGHTFFKLSTLGQRLVNRFAQPSGNVSEAQRPKKTIKSDGKAKDAKKGQEDNMILDDTEKKACNESLDQLVDLMERNPEVRDMVQADIAELRAKYPDFDMELGEVRGHDKHVDKLDYLVDKYSDMIYNDGEYVGESVELPKKAKSKFGGRYSKKEYHNLLDDDEDKNEKEIEGFEKEISEGRVVSPERRKRIEQIIENIRAKNQKRLNEEEEEKEEDVEAEADELSFDDLDLSGEDGEEKAGEEKEKEEGEEELDLEDEGEEKEEGDDDEKVEITEFIITVDDPEAAIEELDELGVKAQRVLAEGFINEEDEVLEGEDLEGEEKEEKEEEDEKQYSETEISVKAEDWETLKGWLEDKGVDVEEMFGGEIEVEDEVEDEGEELDLDVDTDGDGEVDAEMDFDLEGGEEGEGEELDLDLEADVEESSVTQDEPEMEESITGMENHEDDTNNLIKGAKQVVINYK